jgi:hypothetical protein
MSIQRVIAGLLVGFGCGARLVAQIPGTYRLTICARPCTDADSGVVRGHVVLFADTIRRDTLPPDIRSRLAERARWIELRLNGFNACFSLPSGPTRIDGREVYAGIIRRSLTRWETTRDTIKVLLYLSPDAHYSLAGTIESGYFSGRGLQGICCGYPDPPPTFFRASRLGEPDINSCL